MISKVNKSIKKGWYVDTDTYSCKTRHKSRIGDEYKFSDCQTLIDKKAHFFNNDGVYIFNECTDTDSEFGVNKRLYKFNGDFDEFK